MKNKFIITVLCCNTGRLFLYDKDDHRHNQTSDAALMLLSAKRPYPKAPKVPTGTHRHPKRGCSVILQPLFGFRSFEINVKNVE